LADILRGGITKNYYPENLSGIACKEALRSSRAMFCQEKTATPPEGGVFTDGIDGVDKIDCIDCGPN
jgi:hypothetical protein